MAKLKYEFENEYYKSHRRPLRDYLFGYFHVVAALVSPVAEIVNAISGTHFARIMMKKTVGITSQRSMPRFVRRRRKFTRQHTESAEQIIFLSDVFSRYIEPHVQQAALEVLTMCGYEVYVLPVVGAGASLYSKGFIEAARGHARKTLEALNQLDPRREAKVVGLEPPEIYLLKNEYVDLLPDRAEEIRPRVSNVWLIDEFLLRSKEFDALRVARMSRGENATTANTQKIFFHPHCHQRAEGLAADGIPNGAQASLELLRACGYDVQLSDAGCCGMAGTFGFEADHYDLSMQIAELKLLPSLRQSTIANRQSKFCSTGASCRMQIVHGTGLSAQHPIELVRDHLR
jgi:Fe-S oxidoreductase